MNNNFYKFANVINKNRLKKIQMNTKLQELTDKIYNEGVEKGEIEAQNIIEQAKLQANEIVTKAKRDAEEIINNSELKASEISNNTKSELKLFAQQSVNALKTEITDLLCGAIVSNSIKAATTDKVFMQKTILTLVKDWVKNDSLNIEAKDAKALQDYFVANAKELLNNGVTISKVNGVKTDFAISSVNGGYKITFGDDEFIAYFKEFLRPKLVEMLF